MIRNEKGNYTENAQDFLKQSKEQLEQLIQNGYEKGFTFEEIFYMINSSTEQVLLKDLLYKKITKK